MEIIHTDKPTDIGVTPKPSIPYSTTSGIDFNGKIYSTQHMNLKYSKTMEGESTYLKQFRHTKENFQALRSELIEKYLT